MLRHLYQYRLDGKWYKPKKSLRHTPSDKDLKVILDDLEDADFITRPDTVEQEPHQSKYGVKTNITFPYNASITIDGIRYIEQLDHYRFLKSAHIHNMIGTAAIVSVMGATLFFQSETQPDTTSCHHSDQVTSPYKCPDVHTLPSDTLPKQIIPTIRDTLKSE